MVAILDSSGQLACGGSLVDEWVVLVSANSFSLSEDPKIDNGLEDIFPDASNSSIIQYHHTTIIQYEEHDTSSDSSPLRGQLFCRFPDGSGWRVGRH